MNLTNLRYFVAVARQGSISRAARENFTSQQAVSEHIRRLEEYYGTPLLERTRPLSLTPAGRLVFETAVETLDRLDHLERQVQGLARRQADRLVISTGMAATPPFLPDLIAQFHENRPGAELMLIHPSSLDEELKTLPPEADLLVGNLPFDASLEVVELFQDPICVAVSKHLLEKQFGADWQAMQPPLHSKSSARQWGELPLRFAQCSIHRKVEGVQNGCGITADSLELLEYLCRSCQYATVVPLHFAQTIFCGQPDILLFPLTDEPEQFRVGIGTRRGERCSGLIGAFVQLAKKYFASKQRDLNLV